MLQYPVKFRFILLLVLLSLNTCTKLEKEMLVTTGEVTNILANSADASGIIIDLGEGATQSGHYYGKTPNLDAGSSKTELGIPVGTGGFTSQLTNLEAGTKYYLKAYIRNGNKFSYGSETSFTTLPASVPVITTTEVTSVTTNSAVSGGNVTSDGGASITGRGICWKNSPGPTLTDNKTSDGTATGILAANITGLLDATTYYVRAYATNSAGTGYGDEIPFTTIRASLPTVTTATTQAIYYNNVISGGNVTSDGGAPVTERGVCWGTSTGPNTSGNKVISDSGTGSYGSPIDGLLGSTTYFVRAYAINKIGTAYGNEESFTTPAAPVTGPILTTVTPSAIGLTSATTGGNITDSGGAEVIARGICWNTSPAPSLSNFVKTDGSGGIGIFSCAMTGLTPNTKYYVRAYATNTSYTWFGDELTFTTAAVAAVIPTLTTTAVSSISAATATSGGSITSDGGAAITAAGVCWSLSASPTITSSKTTDVPAAGSFASSITGLAVNTLYYVRAYATNSAGTAYGNQVSFTTENPATHIYSLIGTGFYKPDGITQSTWGYDFDFTVIGWTTQVYRYRINQIKMIGNDIYKMRRGHDWATSYGYPDVIITGDPTNFENSSTNIKSLTAKTYEITLSYDIVNNTHTLDFVILSPTITTDIVTGITSITAVCGGNVTSEGTTSVSARGVCWGTSPNPTISGSYTTNGAGIGGFVSNLTGLLGATTYYVRSYATNSSGTSYGNQVSFTTATPLIGDIYQGGIVAYILQSGDPGYVAGQTHGLIVATSDQSTSAAWSNGSAITTGATGKTIGTGSANTTTIITSQGNTGSYAAKLCRDYNGGGYYDWYLPSIDELTKLYLYSITFGGFSSYSYWSSTEEDNYNAWFQNFSIGTYGNTMKSGSTYVRAVRSF